MAEKSQTFTWSLFHSGFGGVLQGLCDGICRLVPRHVPHIVPEAGPLGGPQGVAVLSVPVGDDCPGQQFPVCPFVLIVVQPDGIRGPDPLGEHEDPALKGSESMVVPQVLLAGQLLEVPEPRRPRRFGCSGLHIRDCLYDLPVGKDILAPATLVSVGDHHAVFQFPLFPAFQTRQYPAEEADPVVRDGIPDFFQPRRDVGFVGEVAPADEPQTAAMD